MSACAARDACVAVSRANRARSINHELKHACVLNVKFASGITPRNKADHFRSRVGIKAMILSRALAIELILRSEKHNFNVEASAFSWLHCQ